MTVTQSTTTAVRRYGVFIDGVMREPAAASFDRQNPGTGVLVASFDRSDPGTVQEAIDSARKTFDRGDWAVASGQHRAGVLLRLAGLMRRDKEQLARIEAEEAGKPIRLARGDVESSIGLTEYAAALALTSHGDAHTNLGEGFTGLITREPCGVVAMVTPWNFPLLLLMQKLPFALAAGCTAVCKPSELTAGTTLEVARLLTEAGLPDGAFNVVTGTGSVVGDYLARSDDVDFLSFTGSTAVGRSIVEASAGSMKRLSLELGGKAASIVFPDADLERAADGVLFAVTFNQGECCVSGARLLVHEQIADEFVAVLARKSAELRVGTPLDESADLGSMIHEKHLDQVLRYVSEAESDGAEVVTGGKRLVDGELADGFFVEPTIVDKVLRGSALFSEEVFGPVLAVTRFSSADEAVDLANSVEFGLANSVWSSSIDTALSVSRRLKSGTVWVNTTIDGAPQLPGGGVKQSGYGREMGQAGFDEFTELKTIQIRTVHPA
jgi:acyl-CoA reductase-like NAD-dependent aldehyde dehydrogenase